MSATSTIPVTISDEAAAWLAERGVRETFDQFLDEIRRAVPALKSMTVSLEPPYDTGTEDQLVVWLTRTDPYRFDDPAGAYLGDWKRSHFPAAVGEQLSVVTDYLGDTHAG